MKMKSVLIGVVIGLLICSLIPSGSAISIREIYAEEVWKYDAGAEIQSEIIADSNGVIYFGTNAAEVIALYPNGTLKWNCSDCSYGAFDAGLALSNDESVVYAIDPDVNLSAIYTANGTLKWNYNDNDTGISGIVVDINDNIYVGSWCCANGLFSVDYEGNLRWNLSGDESHSGLAIGKSNTVVYYHDVDFGLREVQLSDGTINWLHPDIWLGSYGTGISIADDGTIYYGSSDYFYAVNPDGSQKWNFAVGGNPGTNNAIGSDGNIWFVDLDGVNSKVFVVTPTGSEVWHYDMLSWVGPERAGLNLALDSYDICYVGCYDNNLHAIDPSGYLRWNFTTGGNILSGILLSSDESTIYFGSDDGFLYAITEICTFDPEQHGIYGWVYETSFYEILEDVDIVCSNASWSDSMTSNDTGYYLFDNLAVGMFWVNATLHSYFDNNANVEVVSGWNESLLNNCDAL